MERVGDTVPARGNWEKAFEVSAQVVVGGLVGYWVLSQLGSAVLSGNGRIAMIVAVAVQPIFIVAKAIVSTFVQAYLERRSQ